MKLIPSVFAVVAGVITFSPALAKEVIFKFDVNSSGPEIYPCDAGLTRETTPQRFCHYKGTTEPCNGTTQLGKILDTGTVLKDIIFDDSQAHACVCSGSDGGWLLDYMVGKYAIWSKDGAGLATNNHGGWSSTRDFQIAGFPIGYSGHGRADAAGHLSVAQSLGPTDCLSGGCTPIQKEFRTQIERLTFNFGSEQYGTEYYVDLCFRGPQIDWSTNPGGIWWTPGQGIEAWLGYTDMNIPANTLNTGNRSYLTLAVPKVQTKLICEWQDTTHRAADDNFTFGHLDETLTNWPLTSSLTNTQGTIAPYIWEYGPTAVASGVTNIIPATTWHPGGIRFCKMRYLFNETAQTDYERGWQRHDGRFFVKLKVEEHPSPL